MRSKTKDYILVGIQLLLMLMILLVTQKPEHILPSFIRYAGALFLIASFIFGSMAVIQMNRHISALPSPKSGSVLLQSGVYRFIRHPMYSALSLAGFSYGLLESDTYKLILSLLLLLFFEIKSQYEETRLIEFFQEYKDYKSRTGKFFPIIFPSK
jgi:protein-S-isoprenylcysteine O-methyltransferase Ste14